MVHTVARLQFYQQDVQYSSLKPGTSNVLNLQDVLDRSAHIHMCVKSGLLGCPFDRFKLLRQVSDDLVRPHADVNGPLYQRDHVFLDKIFTRVVCYTALLVGGELVPVHHRRGLPIVKAIKIRLFSKRNIPKIRHGKDS